MPRHRAQRGKGVWHWRRIDKPSLNAGIDEMNIYSASAINLQSRLVRFPGGTMSFLTSLGIVMCGSRLETHAHGMLFVNSYYCLLFVVVCFFCFVVVVVAVCSFFFPVFCLFYMLLCFCFLFWFNLLLRMSVCLFFFFFPMFLQSQEDANSTMKKMRGWTNI